MNKSSKFVITFLLIFWALLYLLLLILVLEYVEKSKYEFLLDSVLCKLNNKQLEIVFNNETEPCCNEIYNLLCLNRSTNTKSYHCFTYQFYHQHLFKRCFHLVSVEYKRLKSIN